MKELQRFWEFFHVHIENIHEINEASREEFGGSETYYEFGGPRNKSCSGYFR